MYFPKRIPNNGGQVCHYGDLRTAVSDPFIAERQLQRGFVQLLQSLYYDAAYGNKILFTYRLETERPDLLHCRVLFQQAGV